MSLEERPLALEEREPEWHHVSRRTIFGPDDDGTYESMNGEDATALSFGEHVPIYHYTTPQKYNDTIQLTFEVLHLGWLHYDSVHWHGEVWCSSNYEDARPPGEARITCSHDRVVCGMIQYHQESSELEIRKKQGKPVATLPCRRFVVGIADDPTQLSFHIQQVHEPTAPGRVRLLLRVDNPTGQAVIVTPADGDYATQHDPTLIASSTLESWLDISQEDLAAGTLKFVAPLLTVDDQRCPSAPCEVVWCLPQSISEDSVEIPGTIFSTPEGTYPERRNQCP